MKDPRMGRRNRKSSSATLSRPVKREIPMHEHTVVESQWREAGDTFASAHGPIKSNQRAFEVTHEPIAEAQQPMPEPIKQQYVELVELANLATDAAIAKLLMLAARHEGVVVLNNLLAAAFARRGKMNDAMAVVERNYKLNPQYLFGRIQYAQMCLATGRVHAVPGIFDNHFDLKLLYPTRSQFHIREFVAFLAVVAEYHLATGNLKAAQGAHQALAKVAPDHELTLRLTAMLPNAG
jgi:predicted Zn-dependent protease